jgi:hypothetical protein
VAYGARVLEAGYAMNEQSMRDPVFCGSLSLALMHRCGRVGAALVAGKRVGADGSVAEVVWSADAGSGEIVDVCGDHPYLFTTHIHLSSCAPLVPYVRQVVDSDRGIEQTKMGVLVRFAKDPVLFFNPVPRRRRWNDKMINVICMAGTRPEWLPATDDELDAMDVM